MTVTTTTSRIVYTGDASTTIFAYTFKIFNDSDLVVQLDGVTQTLTTDYTVSGAGNPAGGNVTFVTAPGTGVQVLILRTLPITQATDYEENDPFPAQTHEDGLDRLTMIAQQFEEILDRALTIPVTSTLSNISIPDPALAANAGKLLRINPSNTGVDVVDPGFSSDGVITTQGDIIQGGTSGAAERLAVGATGAIPKVVSGKLAYLAPGNADDVLTTVSGVPAYKNILDFEALQHGQCRLTKNGANLQLDRLNGKYILVKTGSTWQLRSIPSAGITLAATGLSVDTNYFIYLYDSSGTLTLEASTTGHATDSDTGVEIKSGDATRTLVGLARVITGPAWQDAADQRFVISYFNRRDIALSAALTANRTTTSTSFVEINTEIRNEFLTWADEAVHASGWGEVQGGTTTTRSAIAVDGAAVEGGSSKDTTRNTMACGNRAALTEGYHYTTLAGAVDGGTGTWSGSGTTAERCALLTIIRG